MATLVIDIIVIDDFDFDDAPVQAKEAIAFINGNEHFEHFFFDLATPDATINSQVQANLEAKGFTFT